MPPTKKEPEGWLEARELSAYCREKVGLIQRRCKGSVAPGYEPSPAVPIYRAIPIVALPRSTGNLRAAAD